MKIDYLKILSRFKNLNDIEIQFDENHLMTVIVGLNGTGKSNVLEALVSIFRNLDLGEAPPFAYEIKYKISGDISESNSTWILIRANPEWGSTPTKQYRISYSKCADKNIFGESIWQELPISKVCRDKQGRSEYLPRYLFSYYSGPSDRLENYFRKHRTDFYRRLLRNELSIEGEIRPLFYAKPIHSQFVLLAFFLGPDDSKERTFLKKHLGIETLDSVHIVLRRPNWVKKADKNELFWGASGVVREFLDRLFPHTMAPIKITRTEDFSLTGSNIKNEFFHLFLPDLQSLRNLAASLSPDEFFKMLESTLLSEIISEVRIRVKVRNIDQALSFRELSEGEQQLLTVLGLLKFTGGADSLFLLDEPDTHLNPAWIVKYLQFIMEFIPNQNTSHIILVTHNPLAIAELEKNQIIIMWRDSDMKIHSSPPEVDPRGMGFAGILKSDMFGLVSTLDAHTTNLIRERRVILEKTKISDEEKSRLDQLNTKLEALGYSSTHWDSEYEEYLKLLNQFYPDLSNESESGTPEKKKIRREKAKSIIQQLLKRKAENDNNN